MLAYDEAEVVLNEKNDIDILITVDTIQADVQLLGVMWEALQQTQLEPADTVTFLFEIIKHRLQRDVRDAPDATFLDLIPLPKPTFTSIMGMAAEVLGRELNRQSPNNLMKAVDWSAWMKDCMYLLLSAANSPMTDSGNYVLTLCLSGGRHKAVFDLISSKYPDPSALSHVLQRLRGGFMQMKGDHMLVALKDLLQRYFCHSHSITVGHPKIINVIRDHPEIPSEHLQYLVDLFIDCLTNEIKPGVLWFYWLEEQLDFIIELSANPTWHNTALKLVQTILTQQAIVSIYCRYPMGLTDPKLHIRATSQTLFVDAILNCNASGES